MSADDVFEAAAHRAQALIDEGDTVGSAVWLRIAGAIRELQGKGDDTPVH